MEAKSSFIDALKTHFTILSAKNNLFTPTYVDGIAVAPIAASLTIFEYFLIVCMTFNLHKRLYFSISFNDQKNYFRNIWVSFSIDGVSYFCIISIRLRFSSWFKYEWKYFSFLFNDEFEAVLTFALIFSSTFSSVTSHLCNFFYEDCYFVKSFFRFFD